MALVFAALSLQPALVRAQVTKRLSRAAVDSLLNPALSPEADKIIAFDAVTKDIGDIKESDSVRTVRFTFRNVSGTGRGPGEGLRGILPVSCEHLGRGNIYNGA